MKTIEKISLKNSKKLKRFLVGLGFVCNSCSSAQHPIYSMDRELIIIKNKKI